MSMKIRSEEIEAAVAELKEKTLEDIQIETAKKWAARAYVAFGIAAYESDEQMDAVSWFHVGEEYRHEALEHAALVSDQASSLELLQEVRKLTDEIRDDAIASAYDTEDSEEAGEILDGSEQEEVKEEDGVPTKEKDGEPRE